MQVAEKALASSPQRYTKKLLCAKLYVRLALWGISNKGKSFTLQKVIKRMKREEGLSRVGKDDLDEGLFEYGNKKIVITAAGDSRGILDGFFKNILYAIRIFALVERREKT